MKKIFFTIGLGMVCSTGYTMTQLEQTALDQALEAENYREAGRFIDQGVGPDGEWLPEDESGGLRILAKSRGLRLVSELVRQKNVTESFEDDYNKGRGAGWGTNLLANTREKLQLEKEKLNRLIKNIKFLLSNGLKIEALLRTDCPIQATIPEKDYDLGVVSAITLFECCAPNPFICSTFADDVWKYGDKRIIKQYRGDAVPLRELIAEDEQLVFIFAEALITLLQQRLCGYGRIVFDDGKQWTGPIIEEN